MCGSLRGSSFLTWVQHFCASKLLFTRRDYFTRLAPSQQILTKPCLASSVFLSSLLAKADLGPLQRFRWHLLWHYLKADYLLNKEFCLELKGPICTYECYKYITDRKNSSPNEFFYDFQLTLVKKKETHGLKHEFEVDRFCNGFY